MPFAEARMPLPEPVRDFCYAVAELSPQARRTEWGVVTVDPRFPLIWDANNAAVLEPAPGLDVAAIEEVLALDLRAAGAPLEHVEVWETSVESRALREMRKWGARTRPDVVMVREPDALVPEPGGVEVQELIEPDVEFWPWFRQSLLEFEEPRSDEVLDQIVERARTVFVPAGLRWFVAFVDGQMAGYTSLISVDGVGYVDGVVTMPKFRGQGVGTATVGRAIEASRTGGDRSLFLLTEQENPARGLYERLGFRVEANVESFTRLLPGGAPVPGLDPRFGDEALQD